MLLFFSCENARSSLSPPLLPPSLSLPRSLCDRSPLRRLTENMRSLITGVTVPALCLRLCPAATIKAGSRSVSAPGVTFEGGSEGKESKKERKKERGRVGGRGLKAGTEVERKSSRKYCKEQEESPYQQLKWKN